MRLRIAALVACVIALSCGDSPTGTVVTGPLSYAGRYGLVSVDGMSLPYTFMSGSTSRQLVYDTLDLKEGGNLMRSVVSRPTGSTQEQPIHGYARLNGYTASNESITLIGYNNVLGDDSSEDATGTIAHSDITIVHFGHTFVYRLKA